MQSYNRVLAGNGLKCSLSFPSVLVVRIKALKLVQASFSCFYTPADNTPRPLSLGRKCLKLKYSNELLGKKEQ